jgi:hypothetical protein
LKEEYRLRVFENRVLRIFGLTGGLTELYNGKRHNLYSSPRIISMIKSRKRRWVRHVAQMGGGGEEDEYI